MYARFFKRLFDALLSLVALLALSPLLLILIVAGAIAFGGKPFFLQPRPGRGERVFYMLKFRSMNDKRDQNGKLLPDGERMTRYGAFLRATSLDELPELINILKGDMAIVGLDWYNLLRTVDKGLGFIAIFYLRDGDIFHSSEPKKENQ